MRKIVWLTIELEQEEDGRWIAEVPEIPGVIVYGATEAEANQKVRLLALSVMISNAHDHGVALARERTPDDDVDPGAAPVLKGPW